MGLQLLTTVWGKEHVEMFKLVSLKSLSWPKNLSALRELKAKWNIFTDDDSVKELSKAMPVGVHFNIQSITRLRDYIDQVQSAYVWQIRECLKSNDRLLIAPPDTIYGDGSVTNLWKMGRDQHSVVVVPHSRAHPEILKEIEDPKSNSELVLLCLKHLHGCWTHAEIGHENQNMFGTGMEWQKLEPNLLSVTHLLPTPYLVHFTEEDLDYFKNTSGSGHYDHRWPGDILIRQGRQRYCGSSDAAFMVELTDRYKNLSLSDMSAPKREFRYKWPHNEMNKQIQMSFRGA